MSTDIDTTIEALRNEWGKFVGRSTRWVAKFDDDDVRGYTVSNRNSEGRGPGEYTISFKAVDFSGAVNAAYRHFCADVDACANRPKRIVFGPTYAVGTGRASYYAWDVHDITYRLSLDRNDELTRIEVLVGDAGWAEDNSYKDIVEVEDQPGVVAEIYDRSIDCWWM